VIASIVFIIWRVWDLQSSVARNKLLLGEFEDQMELIENMSDEFVVSSLKDKRESNHRLVLSRDSVFRKP